MEEQRKILYQLMEDQASESEIVEQSQKLDLYIVDYYRKREVVS